LIDLSGNSLKSKQIAHFTRRSIIISSIDYKLEYQDQLTDEKGNDIEKATAGPTNFSTGKHGKYKKQLK